MTRFMPIARLQGVSCARLAFAGCAVAAAMLFAGAAEAAEATTTSTVGAGSMLQFGLGLAIVLGLIVAAGWFMKRFSIGPSAGGTVKVIAGAAVGQRERVVVVEIGDNWLVLGVAPGRVNALHTMPRGEIAQAPAVPMAGPQAAFATWLKDKMEKRSGR